MWLRCGTRVNKKGILEPPPTNNVNEEDCDVLMRPRQPSDTTRVDAVPAERPAGGHVLNHMAGEDLSALQMLKEW